MAKKSSSPRTTKHALSQFLAFVALILTGVIWLLEAIFHTFELFGSNVLGALALVRDISLLATVAFCAYGYAMKQKKVWRVIYWVIVILSVVAIVFGKWRFW